MPVIIHIEIGKDGSASAGPILLALGLGMGAFFAPASCCHASAAGHTGLSAKSLWQLSSPSSRSLLNPGNILGLEKELTGLFLLNWRGEWFFHVGGRENGGRFVFEDTVQLHLNRNEPDLTNLVNEVYISLQPAEFFFIVLGKQVPAGGAAISSTLRIHGRVPGSGGLSSRTGKYLLKAR